MSFAEQSFFVNDNWTEWKSGETPRRAASVLRAWWNERHIFSVSAEASHSETFPEPLHREQASLSIPPARSASALNAATPIFAGSQDESYVPRRRCLHLQSGRRSVSLPSPDALCRRMVADAIHALEDNDSQVASAFFFTQSRTKMQAHTCRNSGNGSSHFRILPALGQTWRKGNPIDLAELLLERPARQNSPLPTYPSKENVIGSSPAPVLAILCLVALPNPMADPADGFTFPRETV